MSEDSQKVVRIRKKNEKTYYEYINMDAEKGNEFKKS